MRILCFVMVIASMLGCSNLKHKRGADADRVVEHFRENSTPLRHCYDEARKTHPGLEGAVTLQWTVNYKGKVTQSQVLESTLSSEMVESCMLQALRGMEFPKSQLNSKVTVDYTFNFSSIEKGN